MQHRRATQRRSADTRPLCRPTADPSVKHNRRGHAQVQTDKAEPAVEQVLARLQLVRLGGSAGGLAVLGQLFGLLGVGDGPIQLASLPWFSGELPSIFSVGPLTYVYPPPRESLWGSRFGLTGGFVATTSRPSGALKGRECPISARRSGHRRRFSAAPRRLSALWNESGARSNDSQLTSFGDSGHSAFGV
jgi:hypothetical protein